MNGLSWKQSNIAEYIASYINKNKVSPTRYEIRDAMQKRWYKHTLTRQAIDKHLSALENKGILRITDKRKRNIILS
jgi:SOS-response transcriptional repressor LexA